MCSGSLPRYLRARGHNVKADIPPRAPAHGLLRRNSCVETPITIKISFSGGALRSPGAADAALQHRLPFLEALLTSGRSVPLERGGLGQRHPHSPLCRTRRQRLGDGHRGGAAPASDVLGAGKQRETLWDQIPTSCRLLPAGMKSHRGGVVLVRRGSVCITPAQLGLGFATTAAVTAAAVAPVAGLTCSSIEETASGEAGPFVTAKVTETILGGQQASVARTARAKGVCTGQLVLEGCCTSAARGGGSSIPFSRGVTAMGSLVPAGQRREQTPSAGGGQFFRPNPGAIRQLPGELGLN